MRFDETLAARAPMAHQHCVPNRCVLEAAFCLPKQSAGSAPARAIIG